jgi:tetratricopeptide (TPR) repeat protein
MEPKAKEDDQFAHATVKIDREPLRLTGVCFLIAVFVVILYCNSLGNQFTNWDDSMIYGNPQIRSLGWDDIYEMFILKKGATYQPIRVLSYAVDYHFWKLNPTGYHITNILFYILTCIMVFFTLRQLSACLRERASPDSRGRVAFFGSLLFAVHPVHVEAVTWLAARKEVLQGFFFFSGFCLYIKGREEQGRKRFIYFVLALSSFLIAILSKPSAVVFSGVILIYEIARRKENFKRFIRDHWLFLSLSLIMSAIFVFILMKVMVDAGGIKEYRGDSLPSNFLICVYIFLHSIKLLLLTINYSASYTISVGLPIFSWKNFLFTFIGLFLFVFSLFSLRWTKVIFFSFFFFLIALLPYLNIIPISTVLADRYVFIASFSYAFLLGILFDRLYAFKHKRFSEGFFKLLSVVLLVFLLCCYSYMTIHQNKIWENSYTLWADAVEKYPESNMANALMGVVYMDLGMDEKAAEHLEKAVQLLPHDYMSRNNLGIVYGRLNEHEKALQEFSTAMGLSPDDDTIKVNLSVFYQRQKEFGKGEELLKYLQKKNPKNANLHYRLGLMYKDADRYEEAVSEFLRCVELAPDIINGYEELGNLYATRIGDSERAKYYYSLGVMSPTKAKSRVEDLRWMVQDLEANR